MDGTGIVNQLIVGMNIRWRLVQGDLPYFWVSISGGVGQVGMVKYCEAFFEVRSELNLKFWCNQAALGRSLGSESNIRL